MDTPAQEPALKPEELEYEYKLPASRFYEGETGGWKDGRLGQAFDIVYKVLRSQPPGSEQALVLKEVMSKLEAADDTIRGNDA